MLDGNSLYKISVYLYKEITLENVLDWETKADKKYWKLCMSLLLPFGMLTIMLKSNTFRRVVNGDDVYEY
jgi:hypothetical protein